MNDILWGLSFLTENSSEYVELMFESVSPKRLAQLLLHENHGIKVAAMRIVGNVCACSESDTDTLIANDCLEGLKRIITSGNSEPTLVKEGCWVVSNIAAGPAHIQKLITTDIIKIIAFLIGCAKDFAVIL